MVRAGAIALLLGFAMMGLELTAVRLLAPHFGDSAYVWTNVIGVMLVALAVGAWLGGAWAGRPLALRRLSRALAGAALLAAAAPLLAQPLGSWLVPQDLALDAAMAALVRGSLVATLLLFALPIGLLGCASPMLVAALVSGGCAVGRASGLVNACATLGSLLGTFAATHLLVPWLGSRAAVWSCAAVVGMCAGLTRGRVRAASVALLPVLLAGLTRGPLRPAPAGYELLAEKESALQFLQVLRQEQDGAGVTMLKINEGLDSFHSVARAGTAWTQAYYDWHVTAPILAHDGRMPDGDALRVLSLGAAAGTFARLFADAFPGCVVDGVELDPVVVDLGEQLFGGRVARGRDCTGLDARVFVARAPAASYDTILVDAYERQIYVPAHVASVEFFRAAARCLRPGGVVSVNAGGWSFADPVVRALGATMREVFGSAWVLRVPWSRNFVLAARKDASLQPADLGRAQPSHPQLKELLARAAHPEVWRAAAAGVVLHDDRPLLDVLQHGALSGARRLRAAELTRAAGQRSPQEAAVAAHALLAASRPEATLDTIAQAQEATPYLRLLAGDARWALHDLAGARAEFAAAVALQPDADLRGALAKRQREVTALLDGLERAEAIATRNGWLAAALLGAAGFGLVAWLLASRRRQPLRAYT
jgi:spermidine synthase